MIVRSVRINDPIPSAKGITINIRSVLWGIVETITERADPNGDRSLSDKMMSSKAQDDFFLEAEASARLQLEQAMSSFTDGILDGMGDLPLSFGPSKIKRKEKKVKKITDVYQGHRSPSGRMYYDGSAENPPEFEWNVTLPIPDSHCYLEDNLFRLIYPFLRSSEENIASDIDIDVKTCLRTVRLLGCGPSSTFMTSPTGGDDIIESGTETAIIEFIDSGFEERGTRCEVNRKLLLTLDTSNSKDIHDALISVIYPSELKNSTHEIDDVHSKYWDQRYRLFSLYDKGVRMDSESWYSVTPERISIYISSVCRTGAEEFNNFILRRRTTNKKKKRLISFLQPVEPVRLGLVLDLFCGCGGNSIPLGRDFDSVIAVDINPEKLVDARANAKIYNVESRIDFICADAYDVLTSLIPNTICHSDDPVQVTTLTFDPNSRNPPPRVDVVLLAPPWGGPSYTAYKYFDMRTNFLSGDGLELIKLAFRVTKNVICVFPKNIMKSQLNEFIEEENIVDCRLDEIHLYKKHKMSIIFFGPLFKRF